MKTRQLGKTGHHSSIVTLGGALFIYPLGEEGDQFVKYALDKGVNHFDIAPTYGNAEERLGKWVKEYRDDIFLACKTGKRTRKESMKELKRSLKLLQTDYFDLYQFHGLDNVDDLETVVSDDGALNTFLEAKEEGLIKHIGITSHNPENIMRALDVMPLDTILLPVNYGLCAHSVATNDYSPVLKAAKERNIGVIAMKAVAKGPYAGERTRNCWYQPFTTKVEIDEAIRFTLSQNITTAASSSDLEIAKLTIDSALEFTPMTEEEINNLLRKGEAYTPLFPREN
jgi:aryl-alcohol dehydrogenase-like predicted oxidoreductase